MNHIAQLTDEEFALIKKGLDMLANDKNFSRSMIKGLLLGQAPDARSKAELEKFSRKKKTKKKGRTKSDSTKLRRYNIS